jgi:hypothetical protein
MALTTLPLLLLSLRAATGYTEQTNTKSLRADLVFLQGLLAWAYRDFC